MYSTYVYYKIVIVVNQVLKIHVKFKIRYCENIEIFLKF